MALNEYSYHFLRFWKEYPLKVGKGAAWNKWQKICKGEDETKVADMLVEHLIQRNRDDAKWLEGKYVPQPATFLNQARWEDDYIRVRKTAPSHQIFEPEPEPFANALPAEEGMKRFEELKRLLH